MIKDYFRLAYRNTKQRRLRSWLTMIGIFIGIAAVVSLVSLSQGLQSAISEQFVSLGSDKVIIQAAGSGFGPPGTGVSNSLTKDDKEIIEKVKGVESVVGRLIRSVKLESNDQTKYDYVVSIPTSGSNEEMDLVIEANNYETTQGRLLKKGDKYKINVGADFLNDAFDEPLQIRDKIIIQGKDFTIVGVMKKTGNPQNDGTVVVPEDALREILAVDNEYDIIPAKISSGEDISLVTERIEKELRKHRNVEEGKEDFSVQTPEGILATLTNILMIVQGVLVGIAAISLLVGGIGIMNTMYTAVIQRTREIGIMKALGARRRTIMFLFLIESGFLGFLGGLIGILIGSIISKSVELIAFKIYGSYLIQADFNITFLLGMLTFAFLIGAASGALPARQAAQLKPVDALRK